LVAGTVVSTLFAMHAYDTADRLRAEEQLTQDALTDARNKGQLAEERRRLSEQQLAEQYLDRGLAACEREEDSVLGMFWMVRALEKTPGREVDLQRVA